MLALKNLSKKLGDFHLKEISLSVEQGTYFVLLGESGAGKSVLLEIIAGLIKPDSGTLHFQYKEITNTPIQSRRIGLVYQDQALFPHLSVFKNIAYPLHGRKLSKSAIKQEVEKLAEKVGITHLLERNVKTLSIGESQRTALARTLATTPDLLLLDEPLASLDVHAKAEMRALLRKLNREGLTIIHVTHDYTEATALASQLAVIEAGRIAQTGTPTEVFEHPSSEFIAHFTGVKNFYHGTLSRNNAELATFKTANLELEVVTDAPAGPGYLMLRTQDITLSNQPSATSSLNHLAGTVTDIEPAHLGMEVTVDIGIMITAVISRKSITELGIALDQPIWINFKATAARFLSEQL